MATGDVKKLGTFYLGGTKQARPTRPWRTDTTPPGASSKGNIASFSSGQNIEIRNTDAEDSFKLQWVEVVDNDKKYLISDRNLLVNVSWDDLNDQGLINGKEVTIDGQKYLLRVLTGGNNYRIPSDHYSGGTLPNEWDRWIVNEGGFSGLPNPRAADLDTSQTSTDFNGPHNQKWNWFSTYSWGKETWAQSNTRRVSRGSAAARGWGMSFSYDSYAFYGWRPVLEVLNAAPTVTLSSPSADKVLYENDTLVIDGTVKDADVGNSVTVRYQIGANAVRAIKAFVSTGETEAFSRTLTFRGGNLYDGETLIASGLVDGVAHTLKVYATDDQGGQSTIAERAFYVVPNRAPSLTVNTPVISGNIDNDEFEITGSYNDLDKNTTTVAYRINGGSSVQVAQGTGGDFNFKMKFGQLQVGLNSIVIEAIDSYGAKTSRTVKLNKNEMKAEQLKSTARFKIHPPLNTATGIVLWIRRDENLALSASISMTQAAEAESLVQMEKPRTAPMANMPGVVEDQFEYESATAAEKIILQLDMQRSSLTASEKIYLLVGVID